MCNSRLKSPMAQIDGRPVLQPASNRISQNPNQTSPRKLLTKLDGCKEIKPIASLKVSPPVSPKPIASKLVKTPKKKKPNVTANESVILVPSILTELKEKASFEREERKIRAAKYGRVGSLKSETKVVKVAPLSFEKNGNNMQGEKRCFFITPNSDPVFVSYHDEEWGVPVHNDRMLFELLALSGAQVGSDWTSILKKRNDFREAFAGFDAELVAKYKERKIGSLCEKFGLDLAFVRGVVDNARRILEVQAQLGSFDKYLWGFVNHKPLSPNYKSSRKIPAKSSKSDSISKDMVRRGFRLVGPTVIQSFMQTAGLTNDHLVSCHRHLCCSALASTYASSTTTTS
ncbi:hypothetical protein LUZ60_005439 [Juncus effusus]|nr:hypothetical protein LUZ60_005439 [Juncus effusus]